MNNVLLFPRNSRIIGFIVLALSVVLFFASMNKDFVFSFLNTPKPAESSMDFGNHNLTDEFAVAGIVISLVMIAFSKLKHEDEYVRHIRLQSLQIGVYANYAVFLIMTFTVYGLNYMSVLFYNSMTILVLFILVFNFNLYIKPRLSKSEPA